MEKITLDEIITLLDGVVVNYNKNYVVRGISTDTRSIEKGNVFVALKGENFNGNKFVKLAQENGAIFAVVSEDVDCNIPYVKVENTLYAL
ncbi:MAG: Mur ligase domain-containing protein, partial [Clostridium sp.]